MTAGWLDRERVRSAAIVFPFVALFAILVVASPPFLSTMNLLNILDQQSTFLIIAAAGTLVLLAGGIDLSVGAVHALAGVTAAQVTITAGPLAGMAAGVGVGLAAGLANGVVVTVFRINALIATLAMSFVVSGVASLLTGGNLIVVLDRKGGLATTRATKSATNGMRMAAFRTRSRSRRQTAVMRPAPHRSGRRRRRPGWLPR